MFDFLKKAAPEGAPAQKASAAGPATALAAGIGRISWTPRDTLSLIRAGFTGNPVGFRAVKLISEAAAAVPLVLQSADTRYEQHPLLTLLRHPNAVQCQGEWFEALYGQLLLSGNGYVEAVAGTGPIPAELHVLRADRMRVIPGADGWPAAYEYRVGGGRHRFEMAGDAPPICHLRSYHPVDDHYGLSPMQAAAMALDVHNAASRWSKGLLDNAARPSGAIVYHGAEAGGTLGTAQYERLVAEMEANYIGARNAGRPMLLEGGLDWKPMGFSPADMEFQKTKEAAAREIAVTFGVPPMLLGIPGDATYANYQEAHRAFYRLTVLPLVMRVTASLAVWLSGHAREVLDLKPDLDQLPALAAEREAQWKRITEAGFLTAAEKRSMLGLPAGSAAAVEGAEGD